MNTIIHETMVLGPTDVYSMYHGSEMVLIEVHENYQKRSYRNRYFISGPNGIIQLSIPLVKGKNHRTPIRDVRISYDENWVHQHLGTIKSCYGSAPYFIHYDHLLFRAFQKKYVFLLDLNNALFETVIGIIGLNINIGRTEAYYRHYDYGDFRNLFSIKKRRVSSIKYPQVFEEKFGFISGLSILDLVFCTGPESKLYLSRMKEEQ